ncbi:MAG: proton-conducting membrane transporter, partial [Firmicutes bacterium]|nr:proton-conducting membrane transporter [Bacillota bacterium]
MENVFTLLRITDLLTIAFARDRLGTFFLCLVTVMWVLAGIYAQKYKEHMQKTKRFFAFYLLTYVMLAALTMAANYLTMYLCFEFMTLLSMP